MRRFAVVVAVGLVATAGVLVPIWMLSALAPGRVTPGSGGLASPAPILVPDHGFLRSEPYEGTPYVDHMLPEDNYLVRDKVVIGYGRVRGVPWSMAAYLTRASGITNPGSADPPVACVDFFMQGGWATCASSGTSRGGKPIPEDPNRKMYVSGPGYSYDRDDPPEIVVFTGAISKDVASVKVRMADGRMGSAMVLEAPAEIGWNFFVVFPPPFMDLTLIARDEAGNVLERRRVDGCPGNPEFANAAAPESCERVAGDRW
jgi:hypothetical protein